MLAGGKTGKWQLNNENAKIFVSSPLHKVQVSSEKHSMESPLHVLSFILNLFF